MRVIGGLFRDKQDLSLALEDLNDAGFISFNVFGPSELFRSPGTSEEMEESIESANHMAAGTVSGISVNPRPRITDDPSAQPVADDLASLGLPDEESNEFVAGLRQDLLLLLVKTKAERAEEAQQLMQEREAVLVRIMQPEDGFPEEEWTATKR